MRTRSQLRFGLWPDSSTPASHPAELTAAAKRAAQAAIEALNKAGVIATLDETGRARFRSQRIPSRDARLMIEKHADLIEAYLNEQAT